MGSASGRDPAPVRVTRTDEVDVPEQDPQPWCEVPASSTPIFDRTHSAPGHTKAGVLSQPIRKGKGQ